MKNFITEGDLMDDLRCQCSKIICQSDQNTVVIKCRHCKRYMVIKIGPDDIVKEEHIAIPHFQNRRQTAQHACAEH